MRTNHFKPLIITAITFCVIAASAFSQPKDFERMKQRMITMKKINVLEILNLSEEKSDKFLAKYTVYENKIIDLSDKIDNESEDLHKLLEGKSVKANELKQKSESIMKLQDELSAAMSDRFKSIQTILNEEEFAKYLVFERNFQERLRKHLMKNSPRGDSEDDDGSPRGKRRGPPNRR